MAITHTEHTYTNLIRPSLSMTSSAKRLSKLGHGQPASFPTRVNFYGPQDRAGLSHLASREESAESAFMSSKFVGQAIFQHAPARRSICMVVDGGGSSKALLSMINIQSRLSIAGAESRPCMSQELAYCLLLSWCIIPVPLYRGTLLLLCPLLLSTA